MERRERLKRVELQSDVYMSCIQHALSTENYEVMGMLIGTSENCVTKVSSLLVLRRSDKKKDRVEISSEQLCYALTEAEKMETDSGESMRVVGWYHSHPHITVFPSHVDIRTQANYQQMDPMFVGLIFSVFSEVKGTKEQEIHLTCFQSYDRENSKEIPLEVVYSPKISRYCLKAMTNLSKILIQEEEELADSCGKHYDLLASIHNNAVLTRSLVHITDIVTRPLVKNLAERVELNNLRARHLREKLRELEEIEEQISKY